MADANNSAGTNTGMPPVPDAAGSSGGRGNGENRRGGGNNQIQNRRQNHRHGGINNRNSGRRTVSSRFEGNEASLKGHNYDVGTDDADQYIQTTKHIVEYVGRIYKKHTSAFRTVVLDLVLTDPAAIAAPANAADAVQLELWKMSISKQRETGNVYDDFRAWLYSLVMGQCSSSLVDKIWSHADYATAQDNEIELLIIVRSLIHTFEPGAEKLVQSLTDLKLKFLTLKQTRYLSLQRYHEQCLAQIQVLEQVGATVTDDALVNVIADTNNRTNAPNNTDRAEAKQQTFAMLFIRNANQDYEEYHNHLKASFLDEHDVYPNTLSHSTAPSALS